MKTEFQKRKEGNTFGVMIPWTESDSKKYYELNQKLKAKGYESLHEAARKALAKLVEDAQGFLNQTA